MLGATVAIKFQVSSTCADGWIYLKSHRIAMPSRIVIGPSIIVHIKGKRRMASFLQEQCPGSIH